MARKSNEQKLADLHAEALSEFDKVQGALRDERLQCLQDRRFCSIPGAQWEGGLGQQFENRPKFEKMAKSFALGQSGNFSTLTLLPKHKVTVTLEIALLKSNSKAI